MKKVILLTIALLMSQQSFASDDWRVPYVQERQINGRNCLLSYSKEGNLIGTQCDLNAN